MKRLIAILLCYFLAVTVNSQTTVLYTSPTGNTGVWTAVSLPPAGSTNIILEVWGGGGPGGTASGNPATGGGGKGGGYAKRTYTNMSTPATWTTLEHQIAAAATTGNTNIGSAWRLNSTGTGSYYTGATGGANGAAAAANSTNGAGSTTAVGTGAGDVFYDGGNGGTGDFTSGVGGSGAGGGAAGPNGAGGNASGNTAGTASGGDAGAGAAGVGNSTAGAAGNNYGGGGSGGKANNNTDRAGGNGAQGAARITYTPAGPSRKIYIISIADDSELERALNFMEAFPPPIKFEKDEKPEIIVRYPNGLQYQYSRESAVRWAGQPYRYHTR